MKLLNNLRISCLLLQSDASIKLIWFIIHFPDVRCDLYNFPFAVTFLSVIVETERVLSLVHEDTVTSCPFKPKCLPAFMSRSKSIALFWTPGGPVVRNPPCKAEDIGSIPGLGRSHMPWATKPMCHKCPSAQSPCSTAREACLPQQRVALIAIKTSPCRNQRKPRYSNKYPEQPKINKLIFLKCVVLSFCYMYTDRTHWMYCTRNILNLLLFLLLGKDYCLVKVVFLSPLDENLGSLLDISTHF